MDVARNIVENVPAIQGIHALAVEAAMIDDHVPALQAVHEPDPDDDHVPALQSVHVKSTKNVEKVPALHSLH